MDCSLFVISTDSFDKAYKENRRLSRNLFHVLLSDSSSPGCPCGATRLPRNDTTGGNVITLVAFDFKPVTGLNSPHPPRSFCHSDHSVWQSQTRGIGLTLIFAKDSIITKEQSRLSFRAIHLTKPVRKTGDYQAACYIYFCPISRRRAAPAAPPCFLGMIQQKWYDHNQSRLGTSHGTRPIRHCPFYFFVMERSEKSARRQYSKHFQ